jgi:hypothetical protein
MFYLQPTWVIAFVCAFVFFGAGKQNAGILGGKNQSYLWAGLSIAVSAFVISFFNAGWPVVLLAQAGLFVAIGFIGSRRGG